MKFVELFAGIGGFSLGFERAGMTCVGHVEINPYAQKVLLKHWPKVPLFPDVTKIKGDEFEKFEVLCGGFPCQDLSVAGKQKGIHGERSGLFDEIIRIARVCRPEFIVLENVANLISRPEWFGYVLGRLAQIGYDADWEIISASDVGAPHLRKRIWIVAYTESKGGQRGKAWLERLDTQRDRGLSGRSYTGKPTILAYTDSLHAQGNQPEITYQEKRKVEGKRQTRSLGTIGGGQWAIEPKVGRVANGISSRMDRLKCLGNALVPQIAEYIGRQIMESKINENNT